MKLINAIKGSPNQTFVMTLDNGDTINTTLNFIENSAGWFIKLNYLGNDIVENLRLATSPNILQQLADIIPFGLAITTTDNYEPVALDDFTSGRASMFLLNEEDVAAINAAIYANNDK